MRNVQIAESILCLVTSRDRASSTVGDLAEQAAIRGVLWFWSGVLRTAASLIWRAVAESPLHIAAVAFVGVVIGLLAPMLLAAITGLVLFVVGHNSPVDSTGWIILVNALAVLTSLWVGRTLARWVPSRELAACLAYAIISSSFILLWSIFLNSKFVPFGGLRLSDELWVFLQVGAQNMALNILPVLVGAIWGRRRRLAPL